MSFGRLAGVWRSSSTSDTGSGGHGGSGSGNAGSTGNGGSGSGGSGVSDCMAPSDAIITDFGTMMTSAGIGTIYQGADTGLTAPTVSATGGMMSVMLATGMPTTMYPYAYWGLPLNHCVDASGYTGIKFNISGMLTGCTIQFSAVDKEHNLPTNGGTCQAANCYPSSKSFDLPATATDVSVAFADQAGGGADPDALPLDPKKIANIQWQVDLTMGGPSCMGSVTIKNVTFYK